MLFFRQYIVHTSPRNPDGLISDLHCLTCAVTYRGRRPGNDLGIGFKIQAYLFCNFFLLIYTFPSSTFSSYYFWTHPRSCPGRRPPYVTATCPHIMQFDFYCLPIIITMNILEIIWSTSFLLNTIILIGRLINLNSFSIVSYIFYTYIFYSSRSRSLIYVLHMYMLSIATAKHFKSCKIL